MLAIPISLPAPSELPVAAVAVIAFGPIAIGLGIYFYATRHTRLWKRGIYPPTLKFSQDNLLEAYLSLSARMMGYEKGKRSVQVQFINRYFNRYFPMSNYNFADSLVYSMRHPIQIPSVCGWLTAQLPKDPERAQVLFFLAGIASLNGEIAPKERHFLEGIRLELQLSEEILTHIYSIYASFNAHFEERKTQRPMGKSHRTALYRNVLGVPANADVTVIKKAYRSLAKQYHPDTLINATDAQKKMAEDKFNEIRNAYEFLVENRR